MRLHVQALSLVLVLVLSAACAWVLGESEDRPAPAHPAYRMVSHDMILHGASGGLVAVEVHLVLEPGPQAPGVLHYPLWFDAQVEHVSAWSRGRALDARLSNTGEAWQELEAYPGWHGSAMDRPLLTVQVPEPGEDGLSRLRLRWAQALGTESGAQAFVYSHEAVALYGVADTTVGVEGWFPATSGCPVPVRATWPDLQVSTDVNPMSCFMLPSRRILRAPATVADRKLLDWPLVVWLEPASEGYLLEVRGGLGRRLDENYAGIRPAPAEHLPLGEWEPPYQSCAQVDVDVADFEGWQGVFDFDDQVQTLRVQTREDPTPRPAPTVEP